MWNIPNKKRLAKIPKLNDTENISLKDKLIHLHFFIGGCDWYIAEYDGKDMFWGFVILNNDLHMAEWGYFPFSELKSLKINNCFEVDCELEQYWNVKKSSEVDKICEACNWM